MAEIHIQHFGAHILTLISCIRFVSCVHCSYDFVAGLFLFSSGSNARSIENEMKPNSTDGEFVCAEFMKFLFKYRVFDQNKLIKFRSHRT